MQFKEAKEKLRVLADGKSHSISYEENVSGDGSTKTTCSMYIADIGFFEGITFQECIMQIEGDFGLLREDEQYIET